MDGIRNPRAWDPQSRKYGIEIWNPWSGIRIPWSGIRIPWSGIGGCWDPGSINWCPRSMDLGPGSKGQTQRLQSSEFVTQVMMDL